MHPSASHLRVQHGGPAYLGLYQEPSPCCREFSILDVQASRIQVRNQHETAAFTTDARPRSLPRPREPILG